METSGFPVTIGFPMIQFGPVTVTLPEDLMSIVSEILDLQQAQTTKLQAIETKQDAVVVHVQDLVARITALQEQLSAGGQVTPADLQAMKDAALGMEDELTHIESQAEVALASAPPPPPPPPSA